MIAAIADTHAIVWYLFADPRLSAPALQSFETAARTGNQIGISTISIAELIYLTEKNRLDSTVLDYLLEVLDQESVLVEIPFDRRVAETMKRVIRGQVPDLPDRAIAATGLLLDAPIITRDQKIVDSDVSTIW